MYFLLAVVVTVMTGAEAVSIERVLRCTLRLGRLADVCLVAAVLVADTVASELACAWVSDWVMAAEVYVSNSKERRLMPSKVSFLMENPVDNLTGDGCS